MKAKSKLQLYDEIDAFLRERDSLKYQLASQKEDHTGTRKLLSDFLAALKFALSDILYTYPDQYQVAAHLLYSFVSKFKQASGFDLSSGKSKVLDWLADDTGLDQVTINSIKEYFPLFADVIGLIDAGKSKTEIEEFIRQEKTKKNKK